MQARKLTAYTLMRRPGFRDVGGVVGMVADEQVCLYGVQHVLQQLLSEDAEQGTSCLVQALTKLRDYVLTGNAWLGMS